MKSLLSEIELTHNIKFNGSQSYGPGIPSCYMFTDRVSGGTFTVDDLRDIGNKLSAMRKKFHGISTIIIKERTENQELIIGKYESGKFFFKVVCHGALKGLDMEAEYDTLADAELELKCYKDLGEIVHKMKPSDFGIMCY